MKSFFREFIVTLLIAGVVFFGFNSTLQTFIIFMSSMEPNFHEGERLLVNKAAYLFGEPQRGDVIIFEAPRQIQDDYIKRIIGVPGDTVEIKGGAVYVDGAKLYEPYLMAPPAYTMSKVEIPDGLYFVLGDNRNVSDDSHHGWLVPRQNIIGKAWLSTWPPREWGIVPQYRLADQIKTTG